MKIEDALKPGVGPETFFLEYIPELFEARRALFSENSDVDIILSVYLRDIDQYFTCELRADGCNVEADEMVDFPLATIVGEARDWEEIKRRLLKVLVPLEKRAEDYLDDPTKPQPSRLTQDFVDQLERFDGVFAVSLGAQDLKDPIPVQIILNDYEAPEGAPVLQLGVTFETGEALASGELDPKDLPDRIRAGGDIRLGFEIGGLLLKHFPELEGGRR